MSKIGSLCMCPFQRTLWAGFRADIGAIYRAEKSYCTATQDSESPEGVECLVPHDSLVHIFAHPSVDLATLTSCRLVCRKWKGVIEDNDLLRYN